MASSKKLIKTGSASKKGHAPGRSGQFIGTSGALREYAPPVRKRPGVDLVNQWVQSNAPVKQIRDIEALAEGVMGDKQLAHRWLSEPSLALNNRPPIELLGTPEGFDRVKTLLMRIERGVLA